MSLPKIGQGYYRAENVQDYREYLLTRMQTFDLMTGYSIELRIKVNRRWEELEKNNQRELSRKELAMMVLAAEEEKERLQLRARRYERTVAGINNK